MRDLAIPKGKKIDRPKDNPSMISKRGIPYWFAPYWVRNLNGTICRIRAVKEKNGSVNLYMVSKEGNISYIQGSIQEEFHRWCQDREIDCILLGVDINEILTTDWSYI